MTASRQTRRILTTSEGVNREAFSALDWGLFVSISLLWGSSFLLIAVGLEAFEPGLITVLRVGFGAAALWLMPRARAAGIERADWPRVIALSFLWVAIPFTLIPIAQQYINSAIAGMLNGAMPIFATVVAVILLQRLPRRLTILGVAIGFLGVVAISAPSIGQGSSEALGVALVVLATACYGISVNIAAPIQQRYGSIPVMARMLALALIWTAPLGVIGAAGSSFAWGSLIAVAAIGILGTGVAFVVMGNLVGRVGSTRASFITYVIPVVALLLGVVFRGDEVALIAVVGVAMVIVGAIMASRRDP